MFHPIHQSEHSSPLIHQSQTRKRPRVPAPRETEEGPSSGLVSQHKQLSYNQKPGRNSYILQDHVILILTSDWPRAAWTGHDWLHGRGGNSGKTGLFLAALRRVFYLGPEYTPWVQGKHLLFKQITLLHLFSYNKQLRLHSGRID